MNSLGLGPYPRAGTLGHIVGNAMILSHTAAVVICIVLITTGCNHPSGDQPIIDDRLGIMWAPRVSETMLSWDEALQYCRGRKSAGYSDWRLPTRGELESIVNPELVDQNPDSKVVPLYGPFSTPAEGYLFSGTVVPGYQNAPWVMNIRNGHVFNGQGYRAFVRCVRDTQFTTGRR